MFVQDRGRKLATLAVTCIGLFMVLLDMTIVNVALPTIQSDLKTSLADLQWVVDAYTLPFAALLLTAGTLGDRYGRKRMFLVGLVVFTLGSALCGFAPSLQWLIAGRILQGAGGAALSPGSLSLLAAAFPDNRERTQAIGIWAGISGLALAAGPLAGGLLIQISSWPAIFFVNLPIGVLAFIFGWRILAESRNPEARRLDLPGQVLVIGGLAALTYALIEGEAKGWTSPLILSLFIGAGVFLLAFLAVEARAREPLLPLQLFKSVTFSAANAAAVLLGFALLGTAFFISQYFQSVQGASALGSGLRTLPATVGTFVMGPIAGQLAARFGPRVPIALGALSGGIGLLLFTRLDPTTDYANVWWNVALFGIGIGLMISPLTAAVLSSTPPNRAGLGSSMVNTSRQIGSVFGIALLGALVEHQFSGNLVSNLTGLGLPAQMSSKIADTVVSAGAQAGKVQLPGTLPIAPGTLVQTIGQSFTDALHISFATAGVALLLAGLLSVLLLRQPRRQATAEAAPEQAQEISAVPVEL
ncbi:MAG TPA: MFS transporter [Ktedonobacterales bacterium]|nr:MFS transporter [Ktedonobacterales bacterium]